MKKLCAQRSKLHYIDLWSDFTPNNVPNRTLYNLNDPSGVHVSDIGAEVISDIGFDFVNASVNMNDEYLTPTNKKLLRSSTSSTPGSAEKQQSKIAKPM